MRIRVEGTEPEIAAAVERLATVLDIDEASDFYPNRRRGEKYLPAGPAQVVGRVYLTVSDPTAKPVVQAEAERADQRAELPPANRKEIR